MSRAKRAPKRRAQRSRNGSAFLFGVPVVLVFCVLGLIFGGGIWKTVTGKSAPTSIPSLSPTPNDIPGQPAVPEPTTTGTIATTPTGAVPTKTMAPVIQNAITSPKYISAWTQRVRALQHGMPGVPKVIEVLPETNFRVGTFNILGKLHTDGPGANRKGWPNAGVRMGKALGFIAGSGVDVLGFQELTIWQHSDFLNRTSDWTTYPGGAGSRASVQNSIAWKTSVWELQDSFSIDIPYLRGAIVPMPFVLLKNRGTGREIWFANFHNPADVGGNNAGRRADAVSREIAKAKEILTDEHPVVFTGDFNDRGYTFCRITTGVPMRASVGGSFGSPCVAPGRMGIDWIFGSEAVTFSGNVTTYSPVSTKASDHPYVYAGATVAGYQIFPRKVLHERARKAQGN